MRNLPSEPHNLEITDLQLRQLAGQAEVVIETLHAAEFKFDKKLPENPSPQIIKLLNIYSACKKDIANFNVATEIAKFTAMAARERKLEEEEGDAYTILALCYKHLEDDFKAWRYLDKARKCYKRSDAEIKLAKSTYHSAIIYNKLDEIDQATNLLTVSINSFQEIRKKPNLTELQEIQIASGLGLCYCMLGTIALNDPLKDKKQEHFKTALNLAKDYNQERLLAFVYEGLGREASNDMDYIKALNYFNLSRKIRSQINDIKGLVQVDLYAGENEVKRGLYESGIELLEKGKTDAESIQSTELKNLYCLFLARAYTKKSIASGMTNNTMLTLAMCNYSEHDEKSLDLEIARRKNQLKLGMSGRPKSIMEQVSQSSVMLDDMVELLTKIMECNKEKIDFHTEKIVLTVDENSLFDRIQEDKMAVERIKNLIPPFKKMIRTIKGLPETKPAGDYKYNCLDIWSSDVDELKKLHKTINGVYLEKVSFPDFKKHFLGGNPLEKHMLNWLGSTRELLYLFRFLSAKNHLKENPLATRNYIVIADNYLKSGNFYGTTASLSTESSNSGIFTGGLFGRELTPNLTEDLCKDIHTCLSKELN